MRRDFEEWANEAVPEAAAYWSHVLEGSDDMPAHIKASLFGPTLTLPIRDGQFALGTWQGIYLCEHRDHGGPRSWSSPPSAKSADRGLCLADRVCEHMFVRWDNLRMDGEEERNLPGYRDPASSATSTRPRR